MNDKSLALASSIHHAPGVYAVLLGSGVSRSAGIPTGWGIVGSLCEKLARATGEGPVDDPIHWYQQKYNIAPLYDDLIEQLAPTLQEQQSLLETYFEPIPTQPETSHRKKPTPTHVSIAEMVQRGYIRVILTTNFDRLMEQALDQLNVLYQLAYTSAMLKGLRPYPHHGCTIIKLHGDYRTATMRNVAGDLAEYDKPLNDYLDRVFDDFGLIVAGWSAGWDPALRNAMLRSESRRYSWYWLAHGEINHEAREIILLRDANVININDADNLFIRLSGQVQALGQLAAPPEKSADVAVKMLKNFLSAGKSIEIHDLVSDATASLADFIMTYPEPTEVSEEQAFKQLLEAYTMHTKTLRRILTHLIWFGERQAHNKLVRRSFLRVADACRTQSYTRDSASRLETYPILLLLVCIALPALEREDFNLLSSVVDVNLRRRHTLVAEHSLLSQSNPTVIFNKTYKWLTTKEDIDPFRRNVIREILRDDFSEILPYDPEYQSLWMRVEFVLGLLAVHNGDSPYIGEAVAYHTTVGVNEFLAEGRQLGGQWPLIAQLYHGDVEAFTADLTGFETKFNEYRDYQRRIMWVHDIADVHWVQIWKDSLDEKN